MYNRKTKHRNTPLVIYNDGFHYMLCIDIQTLNLNKNKIHIKLFNKKKKF